MKRKLLFAERMLYGNGEAPFNAVIPIRIKGNIDGTQLQRALKRLQQKHPFLNALIQVDEQSMPWFVVEKEKTLTIPIRRVERADNDDWQRESVKEWAIPFDTHNNALMRVVWIMGQEVSDLILVIHHCLCDGGSAMAILTALLQVLDDEQADIGTETPLMTLADIIPDPILKSRKNRTKAQLVGGIANFVLWLIPVKKKLIERKKDYMIHWKLDKDTSDHLIRSCKAANITVNTALCAAVLSAFQAVRKTEFHNKISCPVDIRRYAPQIKKDNIFAFGLMFVVSAYQNLSFLACAKKMQADIDKKTAGLDPYETIMMMEEAHSSLQNFSNFLKYGKSTNDCMFSNLGKIELPFQYQSFELEAIFSPSVIGPLGNTTTLVTSTFRGQMDFTFIASEGFIPYEEALAIKTQMMSILTKEL